jgi:hypothetical protein
MIQPFKRLNIGVNLQILNTDFQLFLKPWAGYKQAAESGSKLAKQNHHNSIAFYGQLILALRPIYSR